MYIYRNTYNIYIYISIIITLIFLRVTQPNYLGLTCFLGHTCLFLGHTCFIRFFLPLVAIEKSADECGTPMYFFIHISSLSLSVYIYLV